MKYIRVLDVLSSDDKLHAKVLKDIIPALFNKIAKS